MVCCDMDCCGCRWSICIPHYDVCDAQGIIALKIVGPLCTCSCFGDVEFKVWIHRREKWKCSSLDCCIEEIHLLIH